MVGSLRAKLFSRLERRRSSVFLTGEVDPDAAVDVDRKPALRVAAAWREDKEGECGLRGDGGPWCDCDVLPSMFVGEMRCGR